MENKNLKRFDHQIAANLLAVAIAHREEQQAHEALLMLLNQVFPDGEDLLHRELNKQAQYYHFSNSATFSAEYTQLNDLGFIGRLAREAFEIATSIHHRKQYGQFFTPPTISALACAAAIRSVEASVIDPMCGIGTMLWSAQDRLSYLGDDRLGSITGVEKDPLAARIASLPPDEHRRHTTPNFKVSCADSFIALSNLLSASRERIYGNSYDAVVGNPPYVRYQKFASMFWDTYPELVQAFRKELPKEPESVIADTIIRATLIAHLLKGRGTHLKDIAQETIALLRSQVSPTDFDQVDACWLKMVAHYSGLADLSLPAWLLTWRLTHPGSIIAYVTTASWRNREYARFLRYFMLRMLQPLFIIEQDGSWFNDALVSTSLLVFRARSSEEISIPLRERENKKHVVRLVRVHQKYNLADPTGLQEAAFRLKPERIAETSHVIPICADVLIREIERQDQDVNNDLWSINVVPEQSLVESLFHEDNATQRTGYSGVTLQELEESQISHKQSTRVSRVSDTQQTTIPYMLQQALNITTVPSNTFKLLTDLGIDVNQGLRTGCNPFFYVRQLTDLDWRQWFPNESHLEIATALENPDQHPGFFLAIMNHLRELNAFVADETSSQCPPSTIVKLDKELGERLAVFPTFVLKPVVRYQKDLSSWAITDTNLPLDRAIVINSAATPQDLALLSSYYPDHWVRVWKERNNLSELPSGLSSYIDAAAKTSLLRNGKSVLIPQLSAVAPNVRMPDRPSHFSLFEDESPMNIPAWWYTLPILPRHTGAVFMARVNDGSPDAYLNMASNPLLIDANFSTFSVNTTKFSSTALFALLNSVWVKSVLETIATPMGGGALKVEAAHLRILPLPNLDSESTERLNVFGKNLAKLPKVHEDTANTLREIDRTVANYLATALDSNVSHILEVLNTVSNNLRLRRKR